MLFSAPMVRAILEGRKTMTRRLVKPQPEEGQPLQVACDYWETSEGQFKCPHPVRSKIWVKETFYDSSKESKRHPVTYRADTSIDEDLSRDFKWKPSIFMPKQFARIWLEVTAVKVERLRDITPKDVLAEGVDMSPPLDSDLPEGCDSIFKWRYQKLWESINGKGSWEKNTWVWCYTFRRIRP